jgi:hypothetical protein
MLFDLDQGNHKNKQPGYLISIGKSCAEYNSAQLELNIVPWNHGVL